jgi:hypothetical protein
MNMWDALPWMGARASKKPEETHSRTPDNFTHMERRDPLKGSSPNLTHKVVLPKLFELFLASIGWGVFVWPG